MSSTLPELSKGVVLQPWQPLICTQFEYDPEECEEETLLNINEDLDLDLESSQHRMQIKCHFLDNYFFLLLTDLISVWYCMENESGIQQMQKELNPIVNAQNILKHVREMLSDDHQFREQRTMKIIFHSQSQSTLTLKCSMMINGIARFHWNFSFKKYGSQFQQSTILKQQMIQPLMDIVNKLTFNQFLNFGNANRNSDSFLEFSLIRGALGDMYKASMTMNHVLSIMKEPVIEDNIPLPVINENVIDIPLLGRRRKKPMPESLLSISDEFSPTNEKRRRISEFSESDSKMSELPVTKGENGYQINNQNLNCNVDGNSSVTANTEKLERKGKDKLSVLDKVKVKKKKKKKKQKKLRM